MGYTTCPSKQKSRLAGEFRSVVSTAQLTRHCVTENHEHKLVALDCCNLARIASHNPTVLQSSDKVKTGGLHYNLQELAIRVDCLHFLWCCNTKDEQARFERICIYRYKSCPVRLQVAADNLVFFVVAIEFLS